MSLCKHKGLLSIALMSLIFVVSCYQKYYYYPVRGLTSIDVYDPVRGIEQRVADECTLTEINVCWREFERKINASEIINKKTYKETLTYYRDYTKITLMFKEDYCQTISTDKKGIWGEEDKEKRKLNDVVKNDEVFCHNETIKEGYSALGIGF